MKKILIAADHAGKEVKDLLIPFIESMKFEVEDLGTKKVDPQDDYPDFIHPLAKRLSEGEDALGIVLGGSGQGEAMVCNRYPGVRAAVYYGAPEEIAVLSREHNDANVLSMGARFLSHHQAKELVRAWLEASFSGDERHVRRIAKIDATL